MSSRRPLCRECVMLLLVASCGEVFTGCSDISRVAASYEQQDWTSPDGLTGVQILTEHYDIRATTQDLPLREYLGPFMEAAFADYAALLPSARACDERMVVYVFGTRPEWASFVRRRFPAQAHTYLHIHAGGFVDGASGDAVLHDIKRERTLSLMAHEGFHQYVRHCLVTSIPPWLNEGLATQFEAFDLPGDGPVPVFTPERNYQRKKALRDAMRVENGMIPLERLIGMHAGQAVVETGRTTRSYYAQLWSLILFLREGENEEYREGFAALLADIGSNRLRQAIGAYRASTPEARSLSDAAIVFRHYITEDLAVFNESYRAFNRFLIN